MFFKRCHTETTPTRITKYHLTLCSIVVVHSSIHDLHNDKDQKTHQKSSNVIPAELTLLYIPGCSNVEIAFGKK